jgi:DNA polymerase I-like protein with 3'-5' exonuclease and polymerase domains
MVEINNLFLSNFKPDDAYIILAVHDEIQCEVRKEYAEKALSLVKQGMENAFYHYVDKEVCPIKVDTNLGDWWSH